MATRKFLGITMQNKQTIQMGLTGVYGLGRFLAKTVCAKMGVNPTARVKDVSPAVLSALQKVVESEYVVQTDLKDQQKGDITRLVQMKCYRGIRHSQNLPVRGQRTSTNGKTAKKINSRRAAFLGIKYAQPKQKKQKGR
eukprot:CAMPEP_0114511828 /NCGR_PEP_ID=MMETSP0109-20121206/14625_1 /TAXON_ID=29199 /ORGANISM="Chlorarachnion reptans, Strain CCCM449" /LENGTH=138 /DNA_ID=CAMNT_0001691421 /DNA_START=44 /DNA_END=460 /DNA_ORIENTATION=-